MAKKKFVLMLLCLGWLALALPVRSLFAQSGTGMKLTWNTPWVVAPDQPEPVQRALEDLERDWYKVFGRRPLVLQELPADWNGAALYFGIKGDWRSLVSAQLQGPESFLVRMQADPAGRKALLVTGQDIRGAIYAAYTFSEQILGVDPWYFWTDLEPVQREEIEVPAGYNFQAGSPTFRYRGWFINDEDLLNKFSRDPLRENVFSLEMFDRIYETLLRLKGNMIVPATFPFPDERCQELAARRGLVLNMHHILVLGLNTYRWPKDVPFSYSKHPEIMEEYWRTCIAAFKDYETVWTVGYRGKHDRAFWYDEPEINTPEARGEIITRAIAKQVELIRTLHPDATIISNLWDEGAEMYHNGLIKIPENVILVWPDNGAGVIRDQANVLAWPGERTNFNALGNARVRAGEGVYYHTAMLSGHANQLSEMVDPARIYRELGRFVRAGATSFFLNNVSDLRPVPMTTECVMDFVWNAEHYLNKTDEQNKRAFIERWCQRQFGAAAGKALAPAYADYFNIPYMGEGYYNGENTVHTRLHRLHLVASPAVEKGEKLPDTAQRMLNRYLNFSRQNLAVVRRLDAQFRSLTAKVPESRRPYYNSHLSLQVRVHLHSLEMLQAYCEALQAFSAGQRDLATRKAEAAHRASNDLYAALRKSEYGKWTGFYLGEGLIPLGRTNYETAWLSNLLKGQPKPLYRPHGGYSEIEDYQIPFADNFPLLYPKPDR